MSTCRTCEVPLDCGTAVDTYSLQEDTYFYTFAVPANPLDVIYMECCDGVRLEATFPADATQALRDAIMQNMVAEFWARQQLCNQGGTEEGGGGTVEGDPTDPNNPLVIYFNHAADCSVRCPDGSLFTYTVPPGRFAGASQATADSAARSYACAQAATRRVCLSDDFPDEIGVGSAITATIRASGNPVDLHFNHWGVSGTLPPGLDLKYEGYGPPDNPLTGTPTTGGSYTFTVTVTTPTGEHMSKTFTVCVVEITSDPAGSDSSHLPDGTVGAAYSVDLDASACATAPLSWQITSGALPPGLTLDEETGEITGTPTTAGTYNITVCVNTEAS